MLSPKRILQWGLKQKKKKKKKCDGGTAFVFRLPFCANPWDRAQHIALEAWVKRQSGWEHDRKKITITALAFSCVLGDGKSVQIPNLSLPTAMESLEGIARHKDGDLGHVVGLEGAFQIFGHVNVYFQSLRPLQGLYQDELPCLPV